MAQVKVKLISCLNHVCKIPSPLPQHVTQYERGHHLFIGCNAHRGRGVQGTVCWGRSLGDHGQVGVSISSPGPQERGSLGHGQLPFTRRHPAWESPGAIYFTLDIGEHALVQNFGAGGTTSPGVGGSRCVSKMELSPFPHWQQSPALQNSIVTLFPRHKPHFPSSAASVPASEFHAPTCLWAGVC